MRAKESPSRQQGLSSPLPRLLSLPSDVMARDCETKRGQQERQPSRMGWDIWAVGADLLPFSRADLGIKWHEIEHRPGSPHPRERAQEGRMHGGGSGRGGWPHAWLLLGADGGEWKGAGLSSSSPPSQPSTLLPSDKHRICWTQPLAEQGPALVPKCPQTYVWGWLPGCLPFRRPLRPFCLSQLLSVVTFAQCPGIGRKGASESGSGEAGSFCPGKR